MGNAIGLSGRHNHMNIIRHQDIGVYRRLVVCGGFFQIMQVSPIILFGVKTRLALLSRCITGCGIPGKINLGLRDTCHLHVAYYRVL
jgi:hypothetical protein